MDINGLFAILWDVTLIAAILSFALGFIYIAIIQRERQKSE